MREMKDSGVAWIGEVPSTWEIRRIKALPDRSIPDSFVDGDWIESPYITDEGIRYLTTGNVGDGKYKEQGSGYISDVTFSKLHCKYAYPGDLVISRLNAPYGRSCILPDTKEKYVLAVDVVILRTHEDKRYLCYLSQCTGYQRSVEDMARGTAMKRISRTNLGTVHLPIPPIEEQHDIADYLDDKCTHIDTLIANVQSQIEKLKAYKQSLITEVVTKGLDPTVPMKDSGVEWIGQIPENYSVIRLRYLIKDYKAGPFGSALITDQLNTSGDILCYTPEHIAQQHTESEKNLYLPENRRSEMSQFFVKAGDVIFPIVGSLGRAMVITDDMPSGIINQRLAKFSLLQEKIDAGYFMWLFAKSTFFQPFINLFQRGSFIVNLTKGIVYDMPFVTPATIAKQKQISEYLDQKCSQIDSLIAIKQSKIEKLEQYKRSLIYEYVTGKREIL